MKILYLELHNYIGIYAGLGKYKVSIDFKNSNNSIIMLFGKNGSGKSTILSSLHPFSGSNNDDRDSIIIDGKNGYKEIHIKYDDKVYKIKHHYNRVSGKIQIKSFLYRISYDDYINSVDNYEDLNENGGVKTFKETVESELGVTEDLFKLSRIGSNVTNFIDLSTADRKLFISKFLPDIDDYLNYYKIINDKYKVMSKEIKFVSDEISKIDSEDNLKMLKNNLSESIDKLKIDIDKYKEEIALCKNSIKSLDTDGLLQQSNYENPYKQEKLSLERAIENIESKYEDINSILSVDYFESILEITSKINELKVKNDNLKIRQNEYSAAIDNLKNKLNDLQIDNTNEYQKLIDEKLSEIEEINSDLNLLNIEESDKNISYDEIFTIKDSAKKLEECAISVNSFSDNLKTIKKILIDNKITEEQLNEALHKSKSKLPLLEEELQDKKIKLSTILSNKDKEIEKLNMRPIDCKDNLCPFIKSALEYENIDSKIDSLNNDIENLKDEIEKLKDNITKTENVLNNINNIKSAYNTYSKDLSKLSLFKKINTINKFAYIICNESILNIQSIFSVENIIKFINYNNALKTLNEKLDNLKIKLDYYNKNYDLYNSYKNEIKENNDKLLNITEEIEINSDKSFELNCEKNQLERFSKIKELYYENKNKLDEINKKYEEIEKSVAIIHQKAQIIFNNKTSLNTAKEKLSELEEKLKDIELKLLRRTEYTDRKKSLENIFEDIVLIKDALNPTKGIPVHFIDNYLNKTKYIANELLELSQNSKFAIDFDIDEKNFFIKVYKSDGTVLSDIDQASQGEIALTSLSLSLALIEQSMSKYNILYLDELDGALDTSNRRTFIDMISNQMKKLNMEQVFIISHNKEFDYYPVDLILLKDNDFDINDKEIMSNKTVLFKT